MIGDSTILLVEDEPDDVELTLLALERAHIANRIDVVNDGAEALDYLFLRGAFAYRNLTLPVVVMLDIKLPKIDGLEVLRQMRAAPRTEHVPVVILTSSDQQRDIAKSYEFGANSYVQKPVVTEEFAAAVQQIGLYWLLLNKAPPTRKDP